jgi:hypothetical protein
VFACESNQQAVEQADIFQAFSDRDRESDPSIKQLRIQVVKSRKYLLEDEFEIEAVMSKPKHPWRGDEVNDDATKRLIAERYGEQRVDEIWVRTSPEHADQWNNDIIFTTMARTLAWGIALDNDVR